MIVFCYNAMKVIIEKETRVEKLRMLWSSKSSKNRISKNY